MEQLKKYIKKYFSTFAFFYTYLRNKVFIAFGLSVLVSIMDGLGLTMFFPLLQVVGGDSVNAAGTDMGKLGKLLEGIEGMGISLTVFSVLMVMIFFFVLKGLASYLSSIYQVSLMQIFIREVRLDLLRNLGKMKFKKFIMSDAGRIQNTMTGEVGNVSNAFTYYFSTVQASLMLIVYFVFAFVLDAKFAALVTVGGLLTHLLHHFIYKHTVVVSRKLTNFGHVFQGQVIQYVNHFKYLRATGRINYYEDRMKETINVIENSKKKMGYLQSAGAAVREPIMVIIIALVILIQVNYLGGSMGAMLISLLFFYRALTQLVALQQSWNNFLQFTGSLENITDFKKMTTENIEKNGSLKIDEFSREIELKEVEFFYDNTQILKDINLSIKKNESVAFVGESGSGKTTLVNLIAGLLPEDKGEILVDGKLLKELNKKYFQRRIGYVSQDPVIFNDSIYNNITFWAEKSEENLVKFNKVIEQASLSEFLNELPDRQETLLGNNGLNLSGGQKQRISIAREFFKDIDILILDEATSALDSETEREIQQSIEDLQGKYTLIIVAHRLSTIRKVDTVVLMNKGEIVGTGSFEQLLAKQEKFRRMVELQEL